MDRLNQLTNREQQVLELVVEGKRNKEIAIILIITENTIESHLKSIFSKLGVSSRCQATAYF